MIIELTNNKNVRGNTAFSRNPYFRGLAMLGTTLGSTLVIIAPAHGQNISSLNNPNGYSLTEAGTRSGGPRTVEVSAAGGDIDIDVGTINVDNSVSNPTGTGIFANNTGSGNVSVKAANVTASGTGQTNGIEARATSGTVTVVNSGTVRSDTNNASRAISVLGRTGNVTVTSNSAIGARGGIFASSDLGIIGATTGPVTTVNSTNAVASGTGASLNAIVGQGFRVVINSGTATNSNAAGTSGAAIFANSTLGGVVINAGTTEALGNNQAGIQALGQSGGTVDITSGTVRVTQNSDAITVQAGSDIIIRSTSVVNSGTNGGFGIVVGGGRTGSFNSGANGLNFTSATVISGAISTAGTNAFGIYVTPNGAGATAITSGAVTTTGAGSTGIRVAGVGTGTITGAVTISTTGRLQTSGINANGVQVNAGSGAVNIANTGQIVTAGQTAFGINVTSTTGAATITGTGSITTTGASSHGIYFNPAANTNTGAISIASGPIAVSGANANGIWAFNAGGAVTINASDVRATGTAASAIIVQPTSGATGPINVAAGIVRATSTGINLSSNGFTGPITVSVADAVTGGAAVDARSVGAVSVTGGTVQTTGAGVTGLIAISTGGLATVNSTNLTSANRGIFAQGLDNVTVNSGTLVSTGADFGLIANTSTVGTAEGVVNVTSTNLTATNIGINAFGPRATINVNSGTVTNGSASAIQAFGIDVNVISGTINTGGIGIEAGNATGAPRRGLTTINSGTINVNGMVAANTAAITANGASLVINSGTITSTGQGNRIGINAQVPTSTVAGTTLPGTLTINSGSITTIGDGAYGIQGITDSGALSITSTGTINTVGTTRLAGTQPRYSAGIIATSVAGSITVDSNNISTQGVQADGVRIEAGSGRTNAYNTSPNNAAAPVSVTTRGTTQTASANSIGINVLGGGGAVSVNNLGTITTGGTLSYGIGVTPQGGETTITSNAISTMGVGATGIRVVGSTGAIAVTASNTAVAGATTNAIELGTTGGITVSGGIATASAGTAILVNAGGAADVRATRAAGGGDGGSGVSVTGGTGVTLNVAEASSTGTSVTNGMTGVVTRADAVFAEATTGAITATIGSATATGAGADAVRLIANGPGGAVSATVTGTLSSTSGTGLFIDPPGAVTVNVAANGNIQGGANGINTVGGTTSIVNLGSISSATGAAILASGQTTLDNTGRIIGATGAAAVQLGATNDIVILRTGSAVTGAIVGGGGTDTATLIGTSTAASAGQSVANFSGFNNLTVQSGYWTAPSSVTSQFAQATIGSGGALELANGVNGIAGIATPSIVSNGTLVIRSSSASGAQTFNTTIVTGTGGVTFTGTGTAMLAGTDSLQNTGSNIIDAGSTVLVTGTQGGAFINNGTFQIGTGGTTGNYTGSLVNSGTLIVNRSDAYTFAGALSGSGMFVKEGAGTISFGSNYAFTGTTMLNGGSIKLATPVAATTQLNVQGSGTIDFSGTTQRIAEIAGSSRTATVNIANGSLTTTQNTNSTFAGTLAGNGSFTKSGTGNLNLTGTNTYTGPTTVNGGTLSVNGSIVSPLTVASGGTLGGTGTVGNTTISSGGVWAPGNSIGTQTVNGNVTFASGSIFAIEANAAGQADRINATGTATIGAATVQVIAAAGNYAPLTNYTILTAQGGINGTFAGATSNLAFLTPFLSYNANTVFLTLGRNDITFASQAVTNNQRRIATAVQGRSLGDPIYNAVLMLTATGAQGAFDELSGEIHASLSSVLVDSNRRIRDAVFARGTQNSGDGFGMWAQGLQSYTDQRTQAGLASIESNRTGVYGGIDYTANGFRFGLSGGYLDDDVRLPGRASRANISTKLVGGSIAWAPIDARVTAQVGGTYAWHDIDTTRTLTTAGLAGTLNARSEATSAQVFGELAYAVIQGPVVVSPFVRYTYGRTTVDALTETGGAAALRVGRERRDTNFASFGVKMSGATPITSGLMFEPRIVAAYVRGWNDLGGVRSATFAGAGPSFLVAGSRLGRDSLDIDIGFDLATTSGIRFGVGGFANTSKQWGDHGGRASVSIRF
ncbi:autotransporter-associated beta strand repeat-containing protein [Sphingomonas sp. 28-62-11]|uniref:autotransporter-associated beta strand repeat-containing protein n=1 Tax=Sphingomonas sp. 28-62-11 TaxID=1970432 RepID=UPI0035A9509D